MSTIRAETVLHEAAQIRDLLDELLTSAMQSKIREWRRGGLPSSSIPQGSRGAEPPLPLEDAVDAWMRRQWINHARGISQSLKSLREAVQAQRSVLNLTADARQLAAPVPCANLRCGELLESGRQKGECAKCRVHRHRFGLDWPLKPDEPVTNGSHAA